MLDLNEDISKSELNVLFACYRAGEKSETKLLPLLPLSSEVNRKHRKLSVKVGSTWEYSTIVL